MSDPSVADSLQAKAILLKQPSWADMEFIRRLWQDPETMEPVGGPIRLTDEQARAWFHRMVDPRNSGDCYRLICDEHGQAVGEVSCHRLDLATMTAELNIKIASQFRGRGFAQAAMRKFLEFFFVDMGGRVLVDEVAARNLIGQHLLRNFGFEPMIVSQESSTFVMTEDKYWDLCRAGFPRNVEVAFQVSTIM